MSRLPKPPGVSTDNVHVLPCFLSSFLLITVGNHSTANHWEFYRLHYRALLCLVHEISRDNVRRLAFGKLTYWSLIATSASQRALEHPISHD